MPRSSQHPKSDTFNFRIDSTLKAAFVAATEADDKPAAQVLRDFMRAYVKQKAQRAFGAEAQRQSRAIAARASELDSDESAVLRELDAYLERDDFADEWKPSISPAAPAPGTIRRRSADREPSDPRDA
jgi:hypothetical protein